MSLVCCSISKWINAEEILASIENQQGTECLVVKDGMLQYRSYRYLDFFCAANAREGHPRRGDSFGKSYDIRLNVIMLKPEHFARTAEARHHLCTASS